ncbi:MAG: hypothetical protein ACT4OK_06260 [Gemmobacter sp.]
MLLFCQNRIDAIQLLLAFEARSGDIPERLRDVGEPTLIDCLEVGHAWGNPARSLTISFPTENEGCGTLPRQLVRRLLAIFGGNLNVEGSQTETLPVIARDIATITGTLTFGAGRQTTNLSVSFHVVGLGDDLANAAALCEPMDRGEVSIMVLQRILPPGNGENGNILVKALEVLNRIVAARSSQTPKTTLVKRVKQKVGALLVETAPTGPPLTLVVLDALMPLAGFERPTDWRDFMRILGAIFDAGGHRFRKPTDLHAQAMIEREDIRRLIELSYNRQDADILRVLRDFNSRGCTEEIVLCGIEGFDSQTGSVAVMPSGVNPTILAMSRGSDAAIASTATYSAEMSAQFRSETGVSPVESSIFGPSAAVIWRQSLGQANFDAVAFANIGKTRWRPFNLQTVFDTALRNLLRPASREG